MPLVFAMMPIEATESSETGSELKLPPVCRLLLPSPPCSVLVECVADRVCVEPAMELLLMLAAAAAEHVTGSVSGRGVWLKLVSQVLPLA